MKKKPISKFTIKREVISNLSKKSQELFLGGYGGYGDSTWIPIITVDPQKSCLFINCQPTNQNGTICDNWGCNSVTQCDGGSCMSHMSYDNIGNGYDCSVYYCP